MNPIEPWVDAEAVRKLAQSLLMPVHREPESRGESYFGDAFVGFAGADIAAAGSTSAREWPSAQAPEESGLDPPHLQEQARESLASARKRAEQGGLLDRFPAPALPAERPPAPGGPVPSGAVMAPTASETNAALGPVPAAPPPPAAGPAMPAERPVPAAPAAVQAPFVERLHAYGQWLRSAVDAKAFFVTDRDGQVLMDQVRSPKLLQVARTLAQASHTASRHAGSGAVGSLHVKLGASSILEVLPVETSYGPLVLGIVVPSVLGTAAIPVISKGLEQVVDGPGG